MLDDKVNAILLLVKRRLILPVHLSVSYVLQDKSEVTDEKIMLLASTYEANGEDKK